ncbi:MAG: TM2 domain-containing protein [Clostridia bacterium]|nr:TM2 domain-containing protein [Clostridia bacterium]
MEYSKVTEYILRNEDYLFFEKEEKERLIQALSAMPDSFETVLNAFPFREPSKVEKIAIFPGILGIDRFYLGDLKGGLLKYITFGGLGVWWIKDIGSAKKRCRKYNYKKLMEATQDPSVVARINKRDAGVKQGAKAGVTIVKELIKGGKGFWSDGSN